MLESLIDLLVTLFFLAVFGSFFIPMISTMFHDIWEDISETWRKKK